jgi:L-threonylcarbamoyladenylate synthase
VILRPGGLSVEKIQDIIGDVIIGGYGAIKAPGMMERHYAPSVEVRLNVLEPRAGERYLGFGQMTCDLNLSESADLEEAAANLFRMMRELDHAGVSAIAVAPIPHHGLGLAINDRLRRAAS